MPDLSYAAPLRAPQGSGRLVLGANEQAWDDPDSATNTLLLFNKTVYSSSKWSRQLYFKYNSYAKSPRPRSFHCGPRAASGISASCRTSNFLPLLSGPDQQQQKHVRASAAQEDANEPCRSCRCATRLRVGEWRRGSRLMTPKTLWTQNWKPDRRR